MRWRIIGQLERDAEIRIKGQVVDLGDDLRKEW